MKRIWVLIFLLSSHVFCGGEREKSESPLSDAMDSVWSTFSGLLTRTKDNLFGHGPQALYELRRGKFKSRDALHDAHRIEWGVKEFIESDQLAKLISLLELADQNEIDFNPASKQRAYNYLQEQKEKLTQLPSLSEKKDSTGES